MIALTVAVFHILGIVSAIHAVMDTRTSQGAIAWAVSLITFPYVAVPAYWVFGRSRFYGYTVARNRRLREIAGISGEVVAATNEFHHKSHDLYTLHGTFERLAGLPFLKGNAVDLLVDGDATFASILKGIDAAREYVLFQFFIVHDDEIGREVKSHLIAKAKEGVRISFLYDEVGSHKLPNRYKEELREAGIEVFDFHTRKGPWNYFQLNFRNHRKVVVVDGQVAWVGGHNVGDEYLGRDPKFGHWRDTHIRIEGPAVLGAQLSFAEDWYWATSQVLKLHWHPRSSPDENRTVLIARTGPADEFETASLMFVNVINSAKERVWIASPYFVPDPPVMAALHLAGLRGVDVRVLIPDVPDHLGVYLATYSFLDEASRSGVKLYRYLNGFLHQKVTLVDRSMATVGTANFDNRSFRLNFEITAIIPDEEFAAQVEKMFEADFASARLMDPGEATNKPLWFRFAMRVARLTAPVQ